MAATQSNLSNGVHSVEQLQEMADKARKNGWPSADVRELYIAFFEHVKHKRYPSSPVVPHGDNTLLFINAGKGKTSLCASESARAFAYRDLCAFNCMHEHGQPLLSVSALFSLPRDWQLMYAYGNSRACTLFCSCCS